MESTHRLMSVIGIATIAVVIGVAATGDIGFGTTGKPLLVLVGSLIYAVAGAAFLLRIGPPDRLTASLLTAIGLAAVTIHHGDPDGPVVGLFLAIAFVPLRLEGRTAAAIALALIFAFNADQALAGDDPIVRIIVTDLGASFFYLTGSLIRRESHQRTLAESLLAELEAARLKEQEAAVAGERARIAREMHDTLAHSMSGLSLQLEGARLLAAGEASSPELQAAIKSSVELARTSMRSAREAVASLRADTVPGPEDIPALIAEHHRLGGMRCDLAITGEPAVLGSSSRLALFRTAQEALANTRKHAPHSPIIARLDWSTESVQLHMVNGISTRRENGTGYGLQGMRERAAEAGGVLTTTNEGDCFAIHLTLPTAHCT